MGFSAAGWLVALAALTIPLAIHLWSRRRTTPVQIGSIRFLKAHRPLSRRTLRLRNPWRLLLRLAMLAALVAALAGPYLTGTDPVPDPERWVLVHPAVAGSDVTLTLLDSLSPGADAIRLLQTGWPELGQVPSAHPADTWSLLVALDQQLPAGSRIDLIAPSTTQSFRGSRPTLGSAVAWYAVNSERGGAAAGTVTRPDPIRIAIMAGPGRDEDARYLHAAIAALASDGDRTTVERFGTGALPDSMPADWIAWLAAEPPPSWIDDRVRAGAVLLTDADDRDAAAVLTTLALHEASGYASIPVTRRGGPPPGAPVWRDGHGATLLAVERRGAGLHYRLATRFHPDWTGLVLDGAFPAAIQPLFNAPPEEPALPVSVSQATPNQGALTGAGPRAAGPSLFIPLWVLTLVLFLVDAALARPRGKA